MQALAAYNSSDDEKEEDPSFTLVARVQAPLAPQLAVSGLGNSSARVPPTGTTAMTMYATNSPRMGRENADGISAQGNTKISQMYAPIQGPSNPFGGRHATALNMAPVGIRASLDTVAIENHTFDQQFRQAQAHARAHASSKVDSSSSSSHGDSVNKRKFKDVQESDTASVAIAGADDDDNDGSPWAHNTTAAPGTAASKQAQDLLEISTRKAVADAKKKGGALDEETEAAVKEMERTKKAKEDKQKAAGIHVHEPDSESKRWERMGERNAGGAAAPKAVAGSDIMVATSTFHGREGSQVDYQGRSWMHPPAGIHRDDEIDETTDVCYIPKKCVKKYSGHSKGVQAIQFLPETGHLLLSASMDGKCKIWDIYNDRQLRRTYAGHSEAVRSINFNNTGNQFLSAGFDRMTRLWDTETGQAVGTFSNRKMGYECKFYPSDNNIFLVAASDNKIYQWDIRTGAVVNEYTHHLGPVNTITFFDEGRKFFSTSDDKRVLSWEFDINVPIRIISDPDMHAIPSVSMHPSKKFAAGQSMDNTVVIYATSGEKLKLIKKKLFKGHNNAGYACQIGFSHNGQFISSGDGFGMVYVWDWKTTKSFNKFKAHDNGPTMGCTWHPRHPSWMATCGWDGMIKLWE